MEYMNNFTTHDWKQDYTYYTELVLIRIESAC